MQRIGLIAVLAVAAYLLVMVIMPPSEDDAAENPLARPAVSDKPMMDDKNKMADKMRKPKMSKEAETRKLLAELKTIPVSEYAVNLEKYERLLELHPNEEAFLRKVAFYSQRLNQQRSAASY